MELQAATLAQMQRARGGRYVLIEEDVGSVVAQIQEIDATLRVRYSEAGGFFVVYQVTDDGEKLVTTAQELDGRLVQRLQEIAHPEYDYVAELEAKEDAADRARDERFSEQVGEIGERMAWAMRRDTSGITGHMRVPRDVDVQ